MPEIALHQKTVTVQRTHMISLVLDSFAGLILYDLLAVFAGFPQIRALVKRTMPRNKPTNGETIERVCNAVDIASCFYFKEVRCLHRSFVAVRLLRKTGVKADLVIGARPIPFISHAWAEVDGRVVNDKQGYKRRLNEIERM
jgi:Transglutaminase-like superfamily